MAAKRLPKAEARNIWRNPLITNADAIAQMDGWTQASAYREFGTRKSVCTFSNIGHHALGFARAGIETVAFCELNPWRRQRIAEQFPGKPIHDDIRTFIPPAGDILIGHVILIDRTCGRRRLRPVPWAGDLGRSRAGRSFAIV
jgi:hypothetical protein